MAGRVADVWDDDERPAELERLAAGGRGDPGGDGEHGGLLETGLQHPGGGV